MWKAIKSFFGFNGVGETALKIVDKLAGTDWTPQQQAEFILKYHEVTKHQSPARRMIATAIVAEHFILAMAWLGYTAFGNDVTALAISTFLSSNVNLTMDIIVSFYFIIHMAKK